MRRCFVSTHDFGGTAEFFAVLIICTVGFFIVFSPLFFVLYFLFKKIKNKNFRILLTAFGIPFTDFIYLLTEHFCFNGEFYSGIIGFCTLFVAVPLCFLTALCSPKSVLPVKWDIIKTSVLAVIFGIGLIPLSKVIILKTDDITAKYKLEKYEAVINNLEDYKKQNGVYPQTIDDNVRIFRQFYYNTLNSDKDYILTVGNSYHTLYNYCSDTNTYGCYPSKTDYVSYEKYGRWIKVSESD